MTDVCVPDFKFETDAWSQGALRVAGVDEVGRGPLAGPVFAAAVVLPHFANYAWLSEVRDSKMLTSLARERLAEQIRGHALVGVGAVSHEEIDAIGIGVASLRAMLRAVEALPVSPDCLLVDGRFTITGAFLPQRAIVDGDALCLSVACASIVAKVARDQLLIELDAEYPGYGFASHKGYSTPEHREALRRLGPCPLHRRSFLPIRLALAQGV
jgi:ribonuclease HII